MSKNLVIVESPAKKKIIQGYLGKDFIVESSIGHIRDLPSKGGMSIDIQNGFAPNYVVSEDKKKVVNLLKSAAKKVETAPIYARDPEYLIPQIFSINSCAIKKNSWCNTTGKFLKIEII